MGTETWIIIAVILGVVVLIALFRKKSGAGHDSAGHGNDSGPGGRSGGGGWFGSGGISGGDGGDGGGGGD